MFSLRPLSLAHLWIQQVVKAGDLVLDATVGNGHDTLFLAQCVGKEGQVVGFDIQSQALERTRSLLKEQGQGNGLEVSLHQTCHSNLSQHLSAPIAAAMFNLGYLPAGDKRLITKPDTTLSALEQALNLLQPSGILTIMCYPGHEGGAQEALQVQGWTQELSPSLFLVLQASAYNLQPSSPFLIGVQRRPSLKKATNANS